MPASRAPDAGDHIDANAVAWTPASSPQSRPDMLPAAKAKPVQSNGVVMNSVSAGTSRVTITNAAWNGSPAAGASASAGFIGTWTGTNAPPAATCTLS